MTRDPRSGANFGPAPPRPIGLPRQPTLSRPGTKPVTVVPTTPFDALPPILPASELPPSPPRVINPGISGNHNVVGRGPGNNGNGNSGPGGVRAPSSSPPKATPIPATPPKATASRQGNRQSNRRYNNNRLRPDYGYQRDQNRKYNWQQDPARNGINQPVNKLPQPARPNTARPQPRALLESGDLEPEAWVLGYCLMQQQTKEAIFSKDSMKLTTSLNHSGMNTSAILMRLAMEHLLIPLMTRTP
jgi:hypothetical protein